MFPFTQLSYCKVRANPVLVVDLEFKESRLRVYIATGAKETSPGIQFGSLASQADALLIELAGPGKDFYLLRKHLKSAQGALVVPWAVVGTLVIVSTILIFKLGQYITTFLALFRPLDINQIVAETIKDEIYIFFN